MRRNSRVQRITFNLPAAMEAVSMYHRDGGRVSSFGEDPLQGDINKCATRQQAFTEFCPSFQPVFHALVNSDPSQFSGALKFYIDITYRLSKT